MKQISLTQGKIATIDTEDFQRVSKFKWYFNENAGGYAARNVIDAEGKRTIQLLHRFVNNTPQGLLTDHINGDRLDNRKANLRTCTASQNQRNRFKMRKNTSGVRGVSFDKSRSKFAAYIKVDYRKIHLGRFSSLEEATKSRRKAEQIYAV